MPRGSSERGRRRRRGTREVVESMLVTLAARGHALLVGVPGLAKTLLVSSLAQALDLSFGRVQFTPDLLPADITGTDVLQETEDDGDPSGFPPAEVPRRPDLRQPHPRRRDQPHAAEDAGRAAPGDAGAQGHGRHRRRTRSPIRSRCSRRATPSSRRGPIRCPRRSSIDFFSRSTSTTRPKKTKARSRAVRPRAPRRSANRCFTSMTCARWARWCRASRSPTKR